MGRDPRHAAALPWAAGGGAADRAVRGGGAGRARDGRLRARRRPAGGAARVGAGDRAGRDRRAGGADVLLRARDGTARDGGARAGTAAATAGVAPARSCLHRVGGVAARPRVPGGEEPRRAGAAGAAGAAARRVGAAAPEYCRYGCRFTSRPRGLTCWLLVDTAALPCRLGG